MTALESDRTQQPAPAEYIRANFQSTDRIVVLVRNRKRSETIQRIRMLATTFGIDSENGLIHNSSVNSRTTNLIRTCRSWC